MDRGMADCRHPDEDYLGRYVLLEEKVISAMEKFDGDYILRELCRTLKGQLRELRNTFCCPCCAYEKKPVSVNRVFENYIRCIEAGGDPVAIVETVQAKLKAVRDRTAMEETTEYAETDASRRELLSVVVTMEGVFRANGCDMDLLETSLSRCALYHGSCRHLDDKAIEPVRELSEKDTVTQLLSLAQRALQYSDRLGQAIDGIGKKRSAKVDYKFAMERSIGYV